MFPSMAKRRVLLGTHWEMLGFTALLFVVVAVFVDLKPSVDENFFFSTGDPGVRESKRSNNVSHHSRSLSWRCHPRIFLPRDTSVESNASPNRSKRSMK
jgi:hypothetical protein